MHPLKQILSHHCKWVQPESASAREYLQATKLQPHSVDNHTPRKLAVMIHRLRLGYKCCREIIEQRERNYIHCDTPTDQPLRQYLLHCTHTTALRLLATSTLPDQDQNPDLDEELIVFIAV